VKNHKELKNEVKFFSRGAALLFFLWGSYFLLRGSGAYVFCYLASFFMFISGIFIAGFLEKTYILFLGTLGFFAGIILNAVLGIIFYLVVTPLGFFFRLFSGDARRGKIKPEQDSYWLERSKKELSAGDYERQF